MSAERSLVSVLVLALAVGACARGEGVEPSATPAVPASLAATPNGPSRIDLAWSHDGARVETFRIERRTSAGTPYAQIASVAAGVRTHVDAGLASGTSYQYRARACDADRCSAFSSPAVATTSGADDRFVDDRPDDLTGAQVHVMYVLPSDGQDRDFDRTGALAASVGSFDNWLAQAAGLRVRLDRYQGAVDVTAFRLPKTDHEMRSEGAFVVNEIQRLLRDAGKLKPDKLYLVYYDGGSTYACGGAMWPPALPGQVAAMYLKGTPGAAQCGSQTFVSSPTEFPKYWEFAALHDLLHTLGIVSQQAPNHQSGYPAHVPEPHDLMYSGPSGWNIGPSTVVDAGGDDYFGPAVPAGIANLANSAFVVPATVAARSLLDAPERHPRGIVTTLPPHPPMK